MKTTLMASLVLGTNLFMAQTSLAHSDQYYSSCDTQINSTISLANKTLFVETTQDQQVEISANGEVYVDGKKLSLTSAQRETAKRYYNEVEASVPMIVDITVGALDITATALGEVFAGLLGDDNELPQKIVSKLEDARDSIEQSVYQDPNSITFNSHDIENSIVDDNFLDEHIDEVVESVQSALVGEILMNLGKAMFNDDYSMDEFGERMDKMGEQIEQKVESASYILEEKAEVLCEQYEQIDNTERKLQQIDALKNLDMIKFNKRA